MSNRIKYMQSVVNNDDQKGIGVFVQNKGNHPDISVFFYPHANEDFRSVKERARLYYSNIS